MRISDWSSDVCSSDLLLLGFLKQFLQAYPIFRRSDSNADRFGHAFQKLGMRIVDAVGITQFQHCVDFAICHGRRSEEHTSELQSLMRISYAVFCLKKKKDQHLHQTTKRTRSHKHNKQTQT